MSTKEEKQLDDLIRKMVVEAGLEQPGPGLKDHIMQGIQVKYSGIVYRSLIPKKGWWVLMLSVAVFVVLAYYNPLGVRPFDIDIFPWDFGGLMGQVSDVTLYAVGVLGLMMCVQVYLLKRRMDRAFQNNL